MKYSLTIFKHTFIATLLTVLMICVVTPFSTITHAQVTPPNSYTLLEPLPCLTGNEEGCSGGRGSDIKTIQIDDYIKYIFDLLMGLAAVAAVFMITWGGFLYMTSDSVGQKSDGLGKATNAIYGLLLVLCSFLILKAINPRLVAIPANLVPKLEITENRLHTNSEFFNSLTSEADKFQVNSEATRNTLRQADANAAALVNQKAELEKEVEIASLNDRIIRQKNDANMIVAGGTFDNMVYQNFPVAGDKNPVPVAEAVALLNAKYQEWETKLKANGAQPDQLQALKNEKEYAEAQLKINDQITEVNNIQNKYFNKQTAVARAVGRMEDASNEFTHLGLSNISPTDWLTYSPAEYKKDLEKAQMESNAKILEVVSEYSAKINDPVLREQMIMHASEKRAEIRSLK